MLACPLDELHAKTQYIRAERCGSILSVVTQKQQRGVGGAIGPEHKPDSDSNKVDPRLRHPADISVPPTALVLHTPSPLRPSDVPIMSL